MEALIISEILKLSLSTPLESYGVLRKFSCRNLSEFKSGNNFLKLVDPFVPKAVFLPTDE